MPDMGIILIFGIALIGGLWGGWLFRLIRIPQIVGYILVGVLIGRSGLQLVGEADISALEPFNMLALAVIGFLVGGELRGENFRKYGKQFVVMLLNEGVAAFVLVGLGSGAVLYVASNDLMIAAAGGVVFGAVAAATDPASTIQVLWEYRTLGMVTTALIALVALDDALAMTLYAIGTSAAKMLSGGEVSILHEVQRLGVELGGALVCGGIAGVVMNYVLHYLRRDAQAFTAAFGAILAVTGIALAFQMDVILAAMAAGVVLVNMAPKRSERLLNTVRDYSNPVYVLFFVLVGTRLGLSDMPGWLWAIVGLYVLARSSGKLAGVFLGARISGADPSVQKYAGLGMMAQGGVAIGLAIMAGHHLADVSLPASMSAGDGAALSLGDAVVYGVTATTLILEIIGPLLAKVAVQCAGEVGRDVKDEDIIEEWTVGNVMETDVEPVRMDTPLSRILPAFSDYECSVLPVVDAKGQLQGMISLDSLKDVFVSREAWNWLLAADVMQRAETTLSGEQSLEEALHLLDERNLEEAAVVRADDPSCPTGMLDVRSVRRKVSQETVRRRQGVAA